MKKKKDPEISTEEEFLEHLWKTMAAQEKNNPSVALLHERLQGEIFMLGLTGGIAAGKTSLGPFFQKHKIPVIDADQIARDVVRPGKKAYRDVVKHFGKEVVGQKKELDRKKIAAIVFNDPSQKTALEAITHPEIFREIVKKIRAFKKKKLGLAVLDAALLFESGLFQYTHKNILITLDLETQLQRLMKRDGFSKEEALERIQAQMPLEEKQKLADYMVDNSGTLEETEKQIEAVILSVTKNLRTTASNF